MLKFSLEMVVFVLCSILIAKVMENYSCNNRPERHLYTHSMIFDRLNEGYYGWDVLRCVLVHFILAHLYAWVAASIVLDTEFWLYDLLVDYE